MLFVPVKRFRRPRVLLGGWGCSAATSIGTRSVLCLMARRLKLLELPPGQARQTAATVRRVRAPATSRGICFSSVSKPNSLSRPADPRLRKEREGVSRRRCLLRREQEPLRVAPERDLLQYLHARACPLLARRHREHLEAG